MRTLLALTGAIGACGCAASTSQVPYSIKQAAGCYVITWIDSAPSRAFPDTFALVPRRETKGDDGWRAAWQVARNDAQRGRSYYVWAWRARSDSVEMWEEASHHGHDMIARRTPEGLEGTAQFWWTGPIVGRFSAKRSDCLGFRADAS